ncbi:hypothetical protein [Methylogaea oryzae]|uniref:Uncharacterized protein n=1 Tax=Methylogaea oryzae TaxID=1295382 RepID=A0A8D4VQB5_9GAMM|nr:hypothetical protein [Methylogaea oryzae]BBL71394.1 hypothetical protein MoryE10_20000 [Methylogaea oryzae]
MTDHFRRLEAIPLSWNDLSNDQKNAVEAVSAWLVNAIDAIPARQERHFRPAYPLPLLDHNRRSQLAFIDGDRGTGKSSVLLTLQNMTISAEPDHSYASDLYEDHKFNAFERLDKLRQHVVWLETLDMEPLSRGTNLFAAILARIAKMLDAGLHGLPPIAAALEKPDGLADVLAKLHQLQNDAAIVWDRMDGTGQGGDPQARALWVMQAEKAGLDLHGRLTEVLDGIARHLRFDGVENPLFVLPVDDFDLAPAHCLELLRLIRMITTPRLFFVIAGNTRIAESVLKLRTEGDLLRLVEGKPSDSNEMQERAAEIAANNMRKLVPPGQRAMLKRLRLEEALRIRAEPRGRSLRDRLADIRFEVNQAPTDNPEMSLSQFLLLDEKAVGGASMTAEWLAGTPRQALDYAEMLAKFVRPRTQATTTDKGKSRARNMAKDAPRHIQYRHDDQLLSVLLEDIGRQIKEDWILPYALRQRLTDKLDTSLGISLDFQNQLYVDQSALREELKTSGGATVIISNPYFAGLFITTGRDSAGGQPDTEGKRSGIEIPRQIASAVLFAHDLAVSLWGGYLRHSALTYGTELGPKVTAVWGYGQKKNTPVVWPLPEWWTFRDYERFAHQWRLHAAQCDGRYGLAWVMAILEVVCNEAYEGGNEGLSKTRLQRLLSCMANEKPKRMARRVLRDSVLTAIALMLAPESASGLDVSAFTDETIGFIRAISNQPTLVGRIRRRRAQIWNQANYQGIAITKQEIELCFAISPERAKKDFNDRVRGLTRYAQVEKQAELLRKSIDYNTKFTMLKTLKNQINATHQDDLLNNLETLLLYEDYYKDKQNKFNELCNGIFIPEEDDFIIAGN